MTKPKDFKDIQNQFGKILIGFEKENSEKRSTLRKLTYRPSREEFPVLELVRFVLEGIMGYRCGGPGEKCAWWICCLFNGHPISFENRKLGFAICYDDSPEVDIKRIVGQLQTAVYKAEKFLEPIAKQCVQSGYVIIENKFYKFDDRYKFFRKLAENSYNSLTQFLENNITKSSNTIDVVVENINTENIFRRDGFYHSVAMIDAYFSRLEHKLILLRAFNGKPLAHGDLLAFFTMKWDEKFKSLVDVDSNAVIQRCYSRLKTIKEKIRNPFAHGGMENDNGSLYIQVPGLGALPATFTKVRNSAQFKFIPIEHEDYRTTCELFDEIDKILSRNHLERPNKLLKAGIDPAFDPNSISKYSKAIESDENTDSFIEYWSYIWEQEVNMDY